MPISVMNNQTCITPQSFHKTLGKILFWTGTIGLLAAFIGPAVFKK